MHCLIFWSNDELEMVRPSLVYQEALHQRICIENEFLAVKPALKCFPDVFGEISLKEFMHAYALVGSRAWEIPKCLSLIPFADFLNHDGNLEAALAWYGDEEISEVIAGRDYAAGEQIFVSYGKLSNAALLLDFGFTLRNNMHDEVKISIDVPLHDPVRTIKMELLDKYCMPTIADSAMLNSTRGSFTINCSSPIATFLMFFNNLEDKWQEISLSVNSVF